jgi:endonuclease/exonuclease/phosphatase family metal-dependent hydrolase
MSSSTECRIGSYNILSPFLAVKWATEEGLGRDAMFKSPSQLKQSTDSLEWVRYSNWEERKVTVSTNITLASIVCLQEIALATLADIQDQIDDSEEAISAYHDSQSYFGIHGTAIVYKSSEATLLSSRKITYTENGYSRSASCATFKIQEKIIRVVSIHLKGYNHLEEDQETRKLSKKHGFNELKAYVTEAEKNTEKLDGIVIAGDFNEDTSEKDLPYYRMGYLEEKGYICDKNMTVTEPRKKRRIDWIYYKPLKTSKEDTKLTTLDLEEHQTQASDHLMTGTGIIWV